MTQKLLLLLLLRVENDAHAPSACDAQKARAR
jgi:hypothetical protein